jgi:hypothetical protein
VLTSPSETRHNTYGAEPLSEAHGSSNNKVIEPHTGLPMNVGRYGDGHGGTDANPTVHGLHSHELGGTGVGTNAGYGSGVAPGTAYSSGATPGVGHEAGLGHGTGVTPGATHHTTDWEAIKKADTPY